MQQIPNNQASAVQLDRLVRNARTSHIVPVSGGKDSTALALRLKELYPATKFIYVYTPTGDELPEMQEQWPKLEKLLGQEIVGIETPTLKELILDFMMLPNFNSRWCTRIIKIEAIQEFYNDHKPAVVYIGLRADEATREGNRLLDADIKQCHPMQEWGWGIKEVRGYLKKRGVTIPRRTDCGMCFYQRLDEWYSLWEQYPDKWREYEDLEFFVGHSLLTPGKWGKGKPTWLFEMRCAFENGWMPREVAWTKKKIVELKTRPKLWPEEIPQMYDYGTRSKCRVCSL